jgi:pimeloyl-ACP methyl ester carboxylesterase
MKQGHYTKLILVFTMVLIPIVSIRISSSLGLPTISMYEISTRGNFNRITGILQHGTEDSYNNITGEVYQGRYNLSNIDDIYQQCATGNSPKEVVIVVHGWGIGEEEAKERFDRVKMSLEHNNYSLPIIGFSWDSNTPPYFGWYVGELIGHENGPKLGRFIADFGTHCPDTSIRVVGHSMGGRVILSALGYLANQHLVNPLKDVHLLGAAVDNQEVSIDPSCSKSTGFPFFFPQLFPRQSIPCSGIAIESEIRGDTGLGGFYNLFSSEDRILSELYYQGFDRVRALGQVGALDVPWQDEPSNYHEADIKDQIPALDDADGNKECDDIMCYSPMDSCSSFDMPCNLVNGTNHAGYFGFRNTDGSFKDDGVMDTVVNDWRSQSGSR